jgi:AraC family transcriptional regulator
MPRVIVWKPGAFAGKTVSMELAGVLMSEVRHTRASSVAPHAHEVPYFSLLLEGSYYESAADFEVRYEPYTLVFHDALTEHSDSIAAGGCKMFFAELLAPWAGSVSGPPGNSHLFEMDGGTPAWLMLKLHSEFLTGTSASPLVVESIMFELCDHLVESTTDADREPPWIARTEEYLRSRLLEPVDLRAIATEMSVDPSHLCRSFRRFRQRSIGDYMMGLRIQLVCRMLLDKRLPLREIAARAGFADQSHMTRIFKRFTGTTPGLYRLR